MSQKRQAALLGVLGLIDSLEEAQARARAVRGRVVAVLRDVDGMTYREIGDVAGVSPERARKWREEVPS